MNVLFFEGFEDSVVDPTWAFDTALAYYYSGRYGGLAAGMAARFLTKILDTNYGALGVSMAFRPHHDGSKYSDPNYPIFRYQDGSTAQLNCCTASGGSGLWYPAVYRGSTLLWQGTTPLVLGQWH